MDPARAGLPDPDAGRPGDGTRSAAGGNASGERSRPAVDDLDGREQKILAFERHWWRYAGAKEQAIRVEFGLSATRYYQILNSLIDKPGALIADPMLVRRLRRLRADRRRARGGHPRPAGA